MTTVRIKQISIVTSGARARARGGARARSPPLQAPRARPAPRTETAVNEWVWCLTSQSSRQQRVETGGGSMGGAGRSQRVRGSSRGSARARTSSRHSALLGAPPGTESARGPAGHRGAGPGGRHGAGSARRAPGGAHSAGPLRLGVPQQCYSASNSVNAQHPRGGRKRLASELKGG